MALWKKKPEDETETKTETTSEQSGAGEPALKLKSAPATAPSSPAAPKPAPAGPASTEIARRAPADLPGMRRDTRPAAQQQQQGEGKKLIVGRDICLNGEITSCEKLVIEGRVQASVTDCREIMIAPSGSFKGSAEIEQAEISGHFQGTLVVRDRLFIRATGRVEGDIRYGRLEIELGGEMTGQIHTNSGQQRLAIASSDSSGS